MFEFLKSGAAGLLIVLAAVLAWRSASRWPLKRSWIPLSLRVAALLLIALLLFYPTLVTTREVIEKPSLLLLVDESASMALPASAQDTAVATATTRADLAKTIYGELKTRHSKSFRINTLAFSAFQREVKELGQANGEGSDLGGAVRKAISTKSVDHVRGAFLISDGRMTRGEDPRIWARQSPFPIHTTRLGPTELNYTDVSVEELTAPEVAFRDGDVPFKIRLSAHGPKEALKKRVAVVLYEGDREVAREVISPGERQNIEMTHRPLQSGFLAYKVKVTPLDGELTTLNNETSTSLLVEDEPRRLLLLSGSPSAELAFFRRSLAGDPRFRLVVRIGPRKNEVVKVSVADLTSASLVVLHKFEKSHYDEQFIDGLAGYVQHGGALLLIGNGEKQAKDLLASPLGNLLPFGKINENRKVNLRASAVVDKLYQFHPLIRVLPHPQANLHAWRSVPPILPGAALEVREKPGIFEAGDRPGFVLTHFISRAGRIPGLMYRSFGSGVLVYLNTEESWRWKLALGLAATKVDVYGGLYHNIVSWAADRGRGVGMKLSTSRRRYYLGTPVTLFLEDYVSSLPVGKEGFTVKMSYVDGAKDEAIIPLEPTKMGWRGEFSPRRPGHLKLSFNSPEGKEVKTHVVIVRKGEEFRQPAADGRLLRDVAILSSGKSLGPNSSPLDIDLNDKPIVETLRSSIFWLDEWLVLFALLLLLCAEWTSRRLLMRI